MAFKVNPFSGGLDYYEVAIATSPGGLDTQLQFNDDGAFGGSSDLVWDDVNDRLGIGISSPDEQLHVSGGWIKVDNAYGIKTETAAGTPYSAIEFASDNSVTLRANSLTANHIRIQSDGLVGINENSLLGQFNITTGLASRRALVVKGAALQTGNLTEWQDSTGSELLSVNSDGELEGKDSRVVIDSSAQINRPGIAQLRVPDRAAGSGALVINTGIELNQSKYFFLEGEFYRYASHLAGNRPGKFYIAGLIYNTGSVFNPNASIVGNYPGTPTVRTAKDSNNNAVFIIGETTDTVTIIAFLNSIKMAASHDFDASNISMSWTTDTSAYTILQALYNCNISVVSPSVVGRSLANTDIFPLKLNNFGGGMRDAVGITFTGGTRHTSDDTTAYMSYLIARRSSASNAYPHLAIGVGANFLTTPSDQFYFTYNGRFGVNDADPSAMIGLQTSSSSTKGLIVQGAPSQTANLQEWQDSSGTTLSSVDDDGNFVVAPDKWFGSSSYSNFTPDGSDNFYINSSSAINLNIDTNNNEVNRFVGVRTGGVGSAGSLVFRFIEDGVINVNELGTTAMYNVQTKSSSTKGVLVKASASQTANLLELQDSSGTALSYLRSDGSCKPASLADTAAANDSIYYSTDASKLVYKDSSGTVNNLY